MAKNNTIFWIVGIVLVILLFNYYKPKPEEGMIGLKVHYYKDGVEIFPKKTFFGFSIVTPPGGTFDQISFDVYGSNFGNIPVSNMQIIDAKPLIFRNALQSGITYSNELAVEEYNKKLWGSAIMNTVDLELISPVNFWIEISGYDSVNQITVYEEDFSGDIVIAEPPSPSISTCEELQKMRNNLGGDFYLTNDIDCFNTISWDGGKGFEPIGCGTSGTKDCGNRPRLSFTGTFDGNGHKISNLCINRPNEDYIGLFGSADGATIENVGLENVNIIGDWAVGGLVGANPNTYRRMDIINCYSTGTIDGDSNVGGIAGTIGRSSYVTNCYSTVNIIENFYSGGLVGSSDGNIENSFATGGVELGSSAGGLVGLSDGGSSISNSYYYNHDLNPNVCVGNDQGATDCFRRYEEEYFYYSPNSPMNVWNFNDVWVNNLNYGFPFLGSTGVCIPYICSSLNMECGIFDDGCGGIIDCGPCGSGQFCIDYDEGYYGKCADTYYLGDCAPGNPMSVVGFIYDENHQPYPIGTEIYFITDNGGRIDIQEGTNGFYYTNFIGYFDATIISCWGSAHKTLHAYVDGKDTGKSFEFETFGGADVSVGSCIVDCSGQQCGPNNCYNDVCGTCGFGYSCDNNICNSEGIGGTDASLYCYTPSYYERREDWIERVQFANIDVTTGPDFDDGYEDLTNNIINVVGDEREYTITVTLGMINDGEERCAAVWFDWDGGLEYGDYGDRIGCCNYNGCTVSEVFSFYSEDVINLMRVKEQYGEFISADIKQPCENEGEIEDYSINII